MTKQERAEKAQKHFADIQKRLDIETTASAAQSIIYGPNMPERTPARRQPYIEGSIELVPLDSVSCAFEKPCEGKTAILNFASYKNPGGFFLGGSAAQEEALCHESNLYPILLHFDTSYYAENRKKLNRAMYTDRAIYSPLVVFEHNGERKEIDVITCAAPNFRAAHRYQNVQAPENEEIFRQRIRFMFHVAELNGVDTLIAGAWGCGVFGQHPGITCRLMMNELVYDKFQIKKVYFAIPNPDGRQPNFIQFEKVMNSFPRLVI